jgi:hypothetical protein
MQMKKPSRWWCLVSVGRKGQDDSGVEDRTADEKAKAAGGGRSV